MAEDEPVVGYGPRPQLPPRPPVPDDRIHGDALATAAARQEPFGGGTASASAPPGLLPPAPRPSAAKRRHRKRWVVLGVGAALVVGGLNLGASMGSVEQSRTLTHAVTGIRVNGAAGEIEVSGGAPVGTVDLARRVSRAGQASTPPSERWEGETLVIDSDPGWCGPLVFGCSIDYTLRVPNGTAVTVDDGSGDLVLSGALGAVDAKTGSGDIKAKDLRSQAVAARSGSGDIDLGLLQAPTQLTVDTGSGDVEVTVPSADTYAVGVQTGSGDEDITVETDANSPRKVQIKTGSGDVKFGYR